MELLLLFILSSLFIPPSLAYTKGNTCATNKECGENENCEAGECKCLPGYEYKSKIKTCESCPGHGQFCHDCCYPPDTYQCYQDNKSHKTCNGHFNHSFIMAAQVALGAALGIAFIALIALFWKTCPRRNSGSGSVRERESSLTSMQRYVLQRLRDRPPRYDDNNQIQLEKPPAYEEVADIQTIQVADTSPPCYTDSIRETDEKQNATGAQSSSESAASSSGLVNHAFTMTDEQTERNVQISEREEESHRSQTNSSASGRINIVLTGKNDAVLTQHVPTEHYI
ncbi:hypothetical protein L9F63_021704 [Diploptera punctata]|uniref:EGF-like domain-containing protein n=1 Tax=Diploptera punctata TaxID=6984 RepID=A0AAD7ZNG0_DIPPU|nr:hypothetical protein L9F63_021704 [Diploptera punctata]